jgi:hypothetical protein
MTGAHWQRAALPYTCIESHKGLRRYGLCDTVVAIGDKTIA